MSVLAQPILLAGERLDLTDWNIQIESNQADWQYFISSFMASTQFVMNGFTVGTVGTASPAQVALAGSTLINANNTGEFSYFVGPSSASPISVPLVSSSRNFLELQLSMVPGVPLARNFWDQSANNGVGAEFIQTVNTLATCTCTVNVNQSGFTGSANTIPLAIVDTDSGNNIVLCLDRRNYFFRLGTPTNSQSGYTWASRVEPSVTVALSGVSGTFVVGETITFSGGATSQLQSGTTTPLHVQNLSSTSLAAGNTVTGGTSGATGTVTTISEAFTGADRSIKNFHDVVSAMQNEIKALKGTSYWFTSATNSNSGLAKYIDSLIASLTATAAFGWDGTNLSITDANFSPAPNDPLATIELLGTSQLIQLFRADGQASTSKIPLSSGQVLFVQLPTTGNRNYAGNGSTSTNYQVVGASSFVASDLNYWICYCSDGSLFFRNGQRLDAGDISLIGSGGSDSGGGLIEVTYADPIDTSLPTGTSATIDGNAVVNGDTVLFTNLSSGNNEIYQVTGVGSSLVWTPQPVFAGVAAPTSGAAVIVTSGTAFAAQLGKFNGTSWDFNTTVRYFNGADYFEQSALITSTLTANTTADIFVVAAAGSENIVIDFSIVRGSTKETGTLWITQNDSTVDLTSGGAFMGSTGLTFSASISSGNLHVSYTLDNSSGTNGTFKYSVKRWSDSAGGPGGVPSYTAYAQQQIGLLNTAFTMSAGAGTQINTSAPYNVSSKTRIDLTFAYTMGLNPSTTGGDLEVLVNGQVLPRFITGVTEDGFYKEISVNTIEFHTDLTTSAVSIEVRRRQGVQDSSPVNALRIRDMYDFVVGSTAQVATGAADFDTISAAVAAAPNNSKILILNGGYVENVTVNSTLFIEGKGFDTAIVGTFTFAGSSSGSILKFLAITGNILFATGSNANILTDAWQSTSSTVTDSGTHNSHTLNGY